MFDTIRRPEQGNGDVQIIRDSLRVLRQIVASPDGSEPAAIATAEACCDALDVHLEALTTALGAYVSALRNGERESDQMRELIS